jgi:hypothetical protein
MGRREFIGSLGGAVAIIAALSGSAYAQLKMPALDLNSEDRRLTPDEQEKRKAVDDAYKSTMQKLPEQKKSADPWGDIRSTQTSPSKPRQQ